MQPHIFRTYDIRGIIDEDFTVEESALIAKAYGTFLIRNGVQDALVGHDGRGTSNAITEVFVDALRSTGVHVHYMGYSLTQGVYYAREHYGIEGGAMITASHNPPNYNGFKLCYGLKCLFEEQLQELRRLAEAQDFEIGQGDLFFKKTAMEAYIDAVTERITLTRPLKVVVDTGNGVGGLFVPRLLRELGCEVISLYADVDPAFPNHIPDPVKITAHEELIRQVKENNADIGIMTDGDGDRVGTVDNEGNIWLGDMILIALMRKFLPDNPGAKVIVEVKNSEAVVEECERLGGVPVFWRTGHSVIDGKVHSEEAILAAEMSCHFWVTPNWYGFDDGVFAVANLLQILASQDKTYAEFMTNVPRYPATPEYRVACPEEKKSEIITSIVAYFKEHCERYVDIDGIRGYYDDGWFLIRQSNTEPRLSVRVEAKTEEGLERVKTFVMDHLSTYEGIHLDWNKQFN